jgi:hypothetical protein
MRTWELQGNLIRHALTLQLTPAMLSADPPLLPATSIDGDHSAYAGPIRMGQLIALPQMNLSGLGLTSAAGRAIATALQTYGAYVVDQGGAVALLAEPAAASLVQPARQKDSAGVNDLMRIFGHLQCVTNNAPGAWGGGGTPLAPPAPPFS